MNSWNVGYSSIRFMETVLDNHTKVDQYDRSNDIQFDIVRTGKLSPICAVLVDIYVLGEAHAYGVMQEFEGVNAIVNNGNWNNIAFDHREFAKRTGVTTLLMPEFLGALNVERLWEYVSPDERKARDRERRKSS